MAGGRDRPLRGAVLTISHDRRFLETVIDQVAWLDRGRVAHLAKNYRHFDAWSEKLLEDEAREQAKLDKLIAEETVVAEGISARRTRTGPDAAVGSLRNRSMVARRGSTAGQRVGGVGKRVIEPEGIKTYEGRQIIAPFSTRILRGDRVGIIGPNGAGKSTPIKMLLGSVDPDQGSVSRGTNLEPLVLDQMRTSLRPGTTVGTIWPTSAATRSGAPSPARGLLR